MGRLSCQHSISQPPVHPCFAWAIKLIAHPKITPIPSFLLGFSSEVAFCTPKISFALPELPFLAKSMAAGRWVLGAFYPRPVLAFGYCRCLRMCVCPCVRQSQVCQRDNSSTSCHQPFKLGSLNLDQRCKRPWLSALLFCGMIDRDLQGQIEPQSQNLPLFELVYAITHHQLKLQFPNLEQKCI